MTSNDKTMYDFAKILEKIDAEVGLVKEAKKKDDKKEEKKEKEKEKAMKAKKDEKAEKAEKKEKEMKKKKKKAEIMNEAVKTLVSLASELEEDGHLAAADLVDDALRIIVDDLDK